MKKALIAAVLMAAATQASAWEEQVINLTDPDGHVTEGEARIEHMPGWYCPSRSDAEVIAKHFRGEISARSAELAFGRCRADMRVVMGVFPSKGISVIFVRQLPDFRPSYFVPGSFKTPDQQEARAK